MGKEGIVILLNRNLGLFKYGVTVASPTELGIYNSTRPLIVETPMQFRGSQLDIGEIGAFTYLGNNSFYRHIGKIGRFCAIAGYVQTGHVEHSVDMLSPHPMFLKEFDRNWKAAECLYEYDDVIDDIREKNYKMIKRKSYIEIGNDVWIGHGVYISRGVKIGDGAVIAARSVVVKDVEPYTVVGGVPAKTIRKRFDDKTIEKLLELKWWEYGAEIIKGIRIYNIEETIYEIEERISGGFKKYTPDRVEFNLKEKSIYHIDSYTNKKKLIVNT